MQLNKINISVLAAVALMASVQVEAAAYSAVAPADAPAPVPTATPTPVITAAVQETPCAETGNPVTDAIRSINNAEQPAAVKSAETHDVPATQNATGAPCANSTEVPADVTSQNGQGSNGQPAIVSENANGSNGETGQPCDKSTNGQEAPATAVTSENAHGSAGQPCDNSTNGQEAPATTVTTQNATGSDGKPCNSTETAENGQAPATVASENANGPNGTPCNGTTTTSENSLPADAPSTQSASGLPEAPASVASVTVTEQPTPAYVAQGPSGPSPAEMPESVVAGPSQAPAQVASENAYGLNEQPQTRAMEPNTDASAPCSETHPASFLNESFTQGDGCPAALLLKNLGLQVSDSCHDNFQNLAQRVEQAVKEAKQNPSGLPCELGTLGSVVSKMNLRVHLSESDKNVCSCDVLRHLMMLNDGTAANAPYVAEARMVDNMEKNGMSTSDVTLAAGNALNAHECDATATRPNGHASSPASFDNASLENGSVSGKTSTLPSMTGSCSEQCKNFLMAKRDGEETALPTCAKQQVQHSQLDDLASLLPHHNGSEDASDKPSEIVSDQKGDNNNTFGNSETTTTLSTPTPSSLANDNSMSNGMGYIAKPAAAIHEPTTGSMKPLSSSVLAEVSTNDASLSRASGVTLFALLATAYALL